MTLSRRTALPLYHQMKELITERIETGQWMPGHQLPSEPELSDEFGVSRTTVRQAMQLLEFEGLVQKVQGKGTFVGRPKMARNLGQLQAGFAPNEISSVQSIHFRVVKAPAFVAGRLNLLPADDVYEFKRVIWSDNDPLMLITCWFPCHLLPGLAEHLQPRRSIWQILREIYGLKVAGQHKEVEVTILDEAEAELLNVRPGAPALLLSYLSLTQDQKTPCEFRKMLVRGDRCKYYVDLQLPEMLV